jgi:hypothetical protein
LQARSDIQVFACSVFQDWDLGYFHGTRQEYTASAGMMLRSTFVVQTVVTFVLSSKGSDVQQDRLAGQSTQRCSLTAGGSVSGYVPLAAFFNGPPGNYEIFTKVKKIIETKCCLGFCCVDLLAELRVCRGTWDIQRIGDNLNDGHQICANTGHHYGPR